MSENQSEPSFEELLAQSEKSALRRVETGQKLRAQVVTLSKGVAYLDIGLRSEAVLTLSAEDPRTQSLREGQDLEVYVLKPGGQVEVGLDPRLGFGDFSILAAAFEEGTEVEGKISSAIPGGYEVNIAGVRCFCPHSQLAHRPDRSEDMVGQSFSFKVIELDPDSSDVVLSRRALLEEARQKQIDETRARLAVDAVLAGRVADIQPFGAFIDLGGLQGLVHISELSHQNVARVGDVLQVGQEIQVKVLDLSTNPDGKERISLSIKALLPDPWDSLTIEQGANIEGTVARLSDFGIFITVAKGIDGLLPRRLLKKAGRPVDADGFQEGQSIEVEVVEINRQDKKITLALPGWDEALKSDIKVGDTLEVEVIKVLPAGVLVQGTEDPAKGLIHKRSLRDYSMKQIVDGFPPGSRHKAVLDEIDGQGRYNFVLKSEKHEVDRETLEKFSSDKGSLEHNPFAAFFGDKKK